MNIRPSIHRAASDGESRSFSSLFSVETYSRNLGESIVRLQMIDSFERAARRFPIFREVRFAARRPRDEVLDSLAVGSRLPGARIDQSSLVLDDDDVFASIVVHEKSGYASGTMSMWAASLPALERVRDSLLALVGDQPIRQEMFTIDWHFFGSHGMTSVAFDEQSDPLPFDEAYPTVTGGLRGFIEGYLGARETVLIMQGPPGTGKTRLVRAILSAISRRKRDSAKILYTSDTRGLTSDELFVEFLTGEHDALVIEDADHLLAARSKGNPDLHRFLTVADGVVRAQGRKIIFTTNLPNLGDLDEALVRPGRCHAALSIPPLDRAQALRLASRLSGESEAVLMVDALIGRGKKRLTVAEIYAEAEQRAGMANRE